MRSPHACRLLWLLPLLILAVLQGTAQEDTAKSAQLKSRKGGNFVYSNMRRSNFIAVKGGPDFCNLINGFPAYNYKIGYAIAISECFFITHNVGIQAGLGFERKGGKLKNYPIFDNSGSLLTTTDYALHVDYVNVPVHLVLAFGKKHRVNILNGIFIAFPVSTTFVPTDQNPYAPTGNLTRSYREPDVGYSGGVTFDINVYKRFYMSPEIYANVGFFHPSYGRIRGLKPATIGFYTMLALKYRI